jgi:hypothetical protein
MDRDLCPQGDVDLARRMSVDFIELKTDTGGEVVKKVEATRRSCQDSSDAGAARGRLRDRGCKVLLRLDSHVAFADHRMKV